jgi:hypothetical protein
VCVCVCVCEPAVVYALVVLLSNISLFVPLL